MTDKHPAEDLVANLREYANEAHYYEVMIVTEEHGPFYPIRIGSFVAVGLYDAIKLAEAIMFMGPAYRYKHSNPVVRHLETQYKIVRAVLRRFDKPESAEDGLWNGIAEWKFAGYYQAQEPEPLDFEPFRYEIGQTRHNIYIYVEFGHASSFLDIMTNCFPDIEVDFVEGTAKDGMQYYYLVLPTEFKSNDRYDIIGQITTHLDRGY